MKFNLIGAAQNTPLEDRLFNASTLICIILGLLALAVNLLADFPITLNIIIFVMLCLSAVFYYFSRFKKIIQPFKISFFAISMSVISYSWFYNDGITGSVPYYFFFATIIFLFTFNKIRYYLILLTIIFFASALILFQFFFPETILPYPSQTARFFDLSFTFLIILILSGFSLILFKQNLDAERNFIYKQKKQIENQYAELSGLNGKLVEQKKEITTQRDEIESQHNILLIKNHIIEEKNKNITDSISYARQIQSAMQPSKKIFENHFSEYFILNKPRDIVSGDFYFIKKNTDFLVLAAADCTGHGIPAAFMSMLGMALLNEIVLKHEITNAGDALNELRTQIKYTLHQTGKSGEQQDGMDIAFCIINLETLQLDFAGAYNPFWIIKNDKFESKKLTVYKGDRQPIGVFLKEDSFTNHTIRLEKGDVFYIFTDGFHSQFGGEQEKKFKIRRFQNLLLRHSGKPLSEQTQILEQEFDLWRGKCEQVDDVLVIGVKI